MAAEQFASERTDGQEWPFDPEPLAPHRRRDGSQVASPGRERWPDARAGRASLGARTAGVTAAIAGSLSAAHTAANTVAGTTRLDAGTVASLDAIFAHTVT